MVYAFGFIIQRDFILLLIFFFFCFQFICMLMVCNMLREKAHPDKLYSSKRCSCIIDVRSVWYVCVNKVQKIKSDKLNVNLIYWRVESGRRIISGKRLSGWCLKYNCYENDIKSGFRLWWSLNEWITSKRLYLDDCVKPSQLVGACVDFQQARN